MTKHYGTESWYEENQEVFPPYSQFPDFTKGFSRPPNCIEGLTKKYTPDNSDMKEALGGKKPMLAHVSPALLNYTARAHQYGSEKYAVGNYLRPTQDDVTRLLEYISAAQRHLCKWADSIIRHQGQGIGAEETLERACFAEDKDDGNSKGSHLPHACGAAASLSMALQQAVDAGLMPIDPGITWK